jgi:hypothetical protein
MVLRYCFIRVLSSTAAPSLLFTLQKKTPSRHISHQNSTHNVTSVTGTYLFLMLLQSWPNFRVLTVSSL